MSEDVSLEVIDSVRRWADGLRAVDAGSPDFDAQVARIAQEVQAARDESTRSADYRFAAFYRDCPTGALLIGPDGVIAAVNPAFLRLVGTSKPDRYVGTNVVDLGSTEHDQAKLQAALTGQRSTPEIRTVGEDARLVELTVSSLTGDGAGPMILMLQDIHEVRELQVTLWHQGLHDPLTGLPNDAHLRSKLETMLAGPADEQVAMLLIDLDGFKVVTDGMGPDVADKVLRGVARTLQDSFEHRPAFLARLRGDVFAVVLTGQLTAAQVVAVTEQTIDDLAAPVYVNDVGIGLSASVGIVLTDTHTMQHQDVVRSAHVALHRAKELGKAQWVLYDPESGEDDRKRYRLACGIAGALEVGDISVIYQPHVVLPDAQIVTSLNVQLRWNHPELGMLLGPEFYPLAEATGMTVPLGKFLLSEALRNAADWRSRHGDGAPMVCLTLPRRMAIDGDLVSIVRAQLDRHQLSARSLMLCADAQSLVDERGDLLEALSHLVDLGVTFILYISGLPELELIPALKVPAPAVMLTGPIVEALADDGSEAARRQVRQLVDRAEELDVKVGAYGVRSQQQADLLSTLGVVVAGGPYLPTHTTSAGAETWAGKVWPMG